MDRKLSQWLVLFVLALTAHRTSADAVLDWNQVAMDAVKGPMRCTCTCVARVRMASRP
jgi:hypothetical protein